MSAARSTRGRCPWGAVPRGPRSGEGNPLAWLCPDGVTSIWPVSRWLPVPAPGPEGASPQVGPRRVSRKAAPSRDRRPDPSLAAPWPSYSLVECTGCVLASGESDTALSSTDQASGRLGRCSFPGAASGGCADGCARDAACEASARVPGALRALIARACALPRRQVRRSRLLVVAVDGCAFIVRLAADASGLPWTGPLRDRIPATAACALAPRLRIAPRDWRMRIVTPSPGGGRHRVVRADAVR